MREQSLARRESLSVCDWAGDGGEEAEERTRRRDRGRGGRVEQEERIGRRNSQRSSSNAITVDGRLC